MKMRFCSILFGVLLVFLVFPLLLFSKSMPETPRDNQGKPWRIAYCESGAFVNYAGTLHALISGLTKIGWIRGDGMSYAEGQKETREMWDWLASHAMGPYIQFVPDAYYSFEGMSETEAAQAAQTIMQRLNEKNDIDMILVMGTQAGQLLANDRHHVPTMVLSVSDAVQAKIVSSVEDSGRDHVWAHVDPGRYERQMEVFHDLFAFKRLGMVYDDSPDGRVYAAVEDVKKVADRRGFTIHSVFVKDKQGDRALHREQMTAAYRQLAEKGVDAVYCTLYLDRNMDDLAVQFEPLYDRRIPVFAQMGVNEVKRGALVSVYRSDFMGLGQFAADRVADVLCGKKPRELSQVYENTPSIALNLSAAEKIGYNPPFEVLLAADQIYR